MTGIASGREVQWRVHLLAAAVAGAASGTNVEAAGFQLMEQNASALGNAYAGTAASAEDASTVFYNPAGMTRLPGRNLVMSLNAIKPSVQFENQLSNPGLGLNTGGDAGSWAFLPALYYSQALGADWNVGLGVNSPFGLKTSYDTGWIGRLQGINSSLKTVAITPSVAYRITEMISAGASVTAQYATAELTSAAGLRGPVAKATGDDWGFGWGLGLLVQPLSSLRIGLDYRSSVGQTLEGPFTIPGRIVTQDRASLRTPATATLSAVAGLSPQWELLADVAWTQWSSFQSLAIINAANGAVLSRTVENWSDAWRFAAGTNYRHTEQWKFRAGIAYDQTPVSDEFRTVRIPDSSRTWLAVGAQYRVTPEGTIDIGYAHVFFANAPINQTFPPRSGLNVTGRYGDSVDILGFQYTHRF
jgi:long-chain fatty acid transport protein